MKRPYLFPLMTVLIALLLVEGFSYAALFFVIKRHPVLLRQAVAADMAGEKVSGEVIHPYLGYVNHYGIRIRETMGKEELELPISNFGFAGTENPVQRRSPDRVIIGILGGSFAKYFSFFGADTLIETLKEDPNYKDKSIVVINLAVDGYKEPQQLMVMSYLLSLGAEFDFILNIDGFNEIVLPMLENMPKKIFPFFPRRWASRIQSIPEDAPAMAGIFFLENSRAGLSRIFGHPILRLSAAVRLSAFLIDQGFKQCIDGLKQDLLGRVSAKAGYAASGPWMESESTPEKFYQEFTAIWKRSSLAIHQLCAASGIRYFHFLQPNQHVPGTKKLTEEERKAADATRILYRTSVEKGYLFLIQAGKELAGQGVSFGDLTNVFSGEKGEVYVDNCCHVSREANKYLGSVVGAWILGRPPVFKALPEEKEAEGEDQKKSENYTLGILSAQEGDLEGAERHFENALQQNPDDADSLFQLAVISTQRKKTDKALQGFEETVRKNPNHAAAHYYLGGILKEKRKTEEALSHYQDAVRLKPEFIMAQYDLAVALAELGRKDEADQHYRLAVQVVPVTPRDHYDRGRILKAQGKMIPAAKSFEQALAVSPELVLARYELGTIQAMMGNSDEAMKQFQEVLKALPGHADARVNIGNILAQRKDFEGAMQYYEAVIQSSPEHARAHLNLGLVLKQTGKLIEAESHFRKSLELEPSYEQARRELETLKPA